MALFDVKSIIGLTKSIFQSKNLVYGVVILLVIMGLGLVYQQNEISNFKQQQHIAQSNELALTDSISTIQTKYGTTLSEIGALQVEKSRLNEINSDLSTQVDRLRNNPITITVIETVIERDTVFVETISEYLGENTFELKWSHRDQGEWGYRILEGLNQFDIISSTEVGNIQTSITRDVLSINITTGFRETPNGMLRVYAETSYPGVTFNSLNSAIIDSNFFTKQPERERVRLVFGPFIGAGYDYELKIRPTFGLAISYNLWGI